MIEIKTNPKCLVLSVWEKKADEALIEARNNKQRLYVLGYQRALLDLEKALLHERQRFEQALEDDWADEAARTAFTACINLIESFLGEWLKKKGGSDD